MRRGVVRPIGNDWPVVRTLPLVAVILVLLAGCGGEIDPARTPAGSAQVRLLENLYNGRFAAAYDDLHPAYQQIVSKARFVSCARQAGLGGVDSIEILDVYDESARIPGVGKVKARAVRVRLTSTAGNTEKPFVNHEVKVGSGWRWVLNDEATQAYKAGRCPGA
jgi:hypothetical protein